MSLSSLFPATKQALDNYNQALAASTRAAENAAAAKAAYLQARTDLQAAYQKLAVDTGANQTSQAFLDEVAAVDSQFPLPA